MVGESYGQAYIDQACKDANDGVIDDPLLAAAGQLTFLHGRLAKEQAELSRLRAELAECKAQRFPIQDADDIPIWLAEEVYKVYSAQYGTDQSLDRLGQRGGLGKQEVVWLLQNNPEMVIAGGLRRQLADARTNLTTAEAQRDALAGHIKIAIYKLTPPGCACGAHETIIPDLKAALDEAPNGLRDIARPLQAKGHKCVSCGEEHFGYLGPEDAPGISKGEIRCVRCGGVG